MSKDLGGSLFTLVNLQNKIRNSSYKAIAVWTVAIAGVVLNVLRIARASTDIGAIAAGLGLILAPIVAVRHVELAKGPMFREVCEDMKESRDTLTSLNKEYGKKAKNLKESLDRLQEMDKKLSKISVEQKTSTDKIVSLIKESKVISQKQRENNESKILQQLITLVLKAADGDLTIIGSELDNLCVGLHMIEETEKFHEDRFRKKILETNGRFRDVMRVVENLMDPSVSEEEEIFKVKHWRLPRGFKPVVFPKGFPPMKGFPPKKSTK